MSVAVQFDTLEYAKKLATAGVPIAQAEAQAKLLGEALTGSIAIAGELTALERALTTRIAAVEARMTAIEARMTTLEAGMAAMALRFDAKLDRVATELGARIDRLDAKVDTLKWMFGLIAALNAGILLKLILSH